MKISVSNYGPIAEAKDIELCPLTVFVGPSNTGKSYLAVLIYALFRSLNVRNLAPEEFYFSRNFLKKPTRQTSLTVNSDTKSIMKDLGPWLKKMLGEENLEFENLPNTIKEWATENIAKAVNLKFQQELMRCMGASSKDNDLIKDQFSLDFEDNKKHLILTSPDAIPSMSIENFNFSEPSFSRFRRYRSLEGLPEKAKAEFFLEDISQCIFHDADRGVTPFYLPAARTGIIQSQRAIAGSLVKQATFVGLEAFSIPTLSGIMADFLEEIILMDTTETPDSNVAKVADDLEKNVLDGSIKLEISETYQYPLFSYKQNGREIPLLRASSMVTELAPVVLFVRYKVGRGDLLIIEEPEAHLHPEAQRSIARTIVHLVHAGVRVMVTTHSDYFLEQLANHVRLSILARKKVAETYDEQEPHLEENEIGAYRFVPKEDKGTVVERLHFDQENGLSPKDHDKVSSDLYNETVEILEKIDNKE